MRLNNTTDIPDSVIREVIRFVRPPGISGFDVNVKNTNQGITGRAYIQGSAYHDTANPFVVLRIGRTGWPQKAHGPHKPGYLGVPDLENKVEGLVFLAAHELRHLWQAAESSEDVPRGAGANTPREMQTLTHLRCSESGKPAKKPLDIRSGPV
jgi:hypothetical protein